MYSLLMMTALAGGGSDAPAFGGRFLGPTYGSCGGVSYVPSYYGSCYGSSCYGGSYYSACTGCYGSAYYGPACGGYSSYASACCGYTACCGGGLFSGLFSHFHTSSCRGYSSCCGYSSACCGYTAGYYYGSCCGYSSCCGGGYGSPYYSVYGGCYGSCVGSVYPSYSPGVMVAPFAPVIAAPVDGVIVGSAATPAGPVVTASRAEIGTNGLLAAAPKNDSAPARLVIELPAKATLYVDGVAVPGKGESRQFHTPDLTRNKAYYYELKAAVLVDGKVEVEEKKVVIRAGDTAIEAFPKLIALSRRAASPTVVAAK